MTERELPAGITRLEPGTGHPLDDLPLVDPRDVDARSFPFPLLAPTEPPTRLEVPESVVDEDELWTEYAEACGFGPREEWIAFGDGPDQEYVDDFTFERLCGSDAEDRALWHGGEPTPPPSSWKDERDWHEYERDVFAHEEAVAEAHAEHERERERLFEALHEAREADLARQAASALLASSSRSVGSWARRVTLRGPRSRRARPGRSRARSPGRPSGDDDPEPSRRHVAARREAGS